ncbi:hypothetical protein KO525_00070 [Psychrosphaera sp. B3R10]|uniref:hypothetical protein n=1 Tax=unclassified Psychrosphaera TaxID=2641570 RepID=UPI001C0952F1|nr:MULTISPECIES: hypothetical protein [unclassified Psychrosphaera]MBU2880341.1 hypothetical protein [Psychrosphaera sp. I2R16]MBU2987780.1 hypothetical protein [Psychrosphaera sp. B3R10]
MYRLFVVLGFLMSSSVFANPTHKVSYDETTQMVNVETQLCLYGRGIQQALIETSYQNLSNYLRVEYRQISTSLANKHNLKKKQREYIEYLLTLKLNKTTLQHDFSFVGNDTCTTAKGNFELAEQVKFESLFDFPPPAMFHFVTTAQNLNQYLTQKLNLYNVVVRPELFAKHLTVIDNLSVQDTAKTYYQFDLTAYNSSLSLASNSVYIDAEQPYVKILSKYLQSRSFSIQSQPSNAFWTVKLTANIEDQKYLSLQLEISNTDDFQTILVNNSRQLPATTLSNPIMLEKFFNVHIELMKLNEHLRTKR